MYKLCWWDINQSRVSGQWGVNNSGYTGITIQLLASRLVLKISAVTWHNKMFIKYAESISHIHLVKSPYKEFWKGEACSETVNNCSLYYIWSEPFRFYSASLARLLLGRGVTLAEHDRHVKSCDAPGCLTKLLQKSDRNKAKTPFPPRKESLFFF